MEGKENIRGESHLQKLLTAKDVAEVLGIAAKTVHKLVREGKLGCVLVTSKGRRFTEQQVRDYIEAGSKWPREVRIDTRIVRKVSSRPPKGGEKSIGVSKADLRKEMSLWQ